MLVLTKNKYDVEEQIQVKGEDGNLLVDYTMQITPEERLEIEEIILSDKDYTIAKKMQKFERKKDLDSLDELEEKVIEDAKKRQERFETLIFKEEKDNIYSKLGKATYLDLVTQIFDFFFKALIEKRAKQTNTTNTYLRKVTNS